MSEGSHKIKLITSPGLEPWAIRIPLNSPLHDRSYGPRRSVDDDTEEVDYFTFGDRRVPKTPPSRAPTASSVTTTAGNKMLISLTVGKVDAGVAVLLTEDKRLVRESRLQTSQFLRASKMPSRTRRVSPSAQKQTFEISVC